MLSSIDSEEALRKNSINLCCLLREETFLSAVVPKAFSVVLRGIIASSSKDMSFVGGIYNPCKDLFLFVMGQKHDNEALQERVSELINLLMIISSEKEKIDAFLRNSVSTEESQAYPSTKEEIAVITKKYIKFIAEYAKSTTNQLTSTTELNPSTASLMIHQLSDLKTNVMSKKFFKLAKLSRDVAKLSKRASAVIPKLKLEYMARKKLEPIQDELGGRGGDESVLPVFDMYVDQVLEHLFGVGACTVGISGRKGVGKTTVLRKLHDRVLEQKLQWGDIIWISYPAETETEEGAAALQSEIIGQLNIAEHSKATTSKDTNANIISVFLRKRRYILLMDHVSTPIDLDKIGIRKNHGNRKVVICSRETAVISAMADEEVEIKGLDKVDARELFQSIYGKLYDDFKLSSVDIISEYCGGTAGMIHLIAHYLKDKEDDRIWWHHVKRTLQAESKSHELLDLADFDKVYDMTYQALEPEVRKCLLYGALFPHRYQIYAGYLTECWIAEGLIAERADQKVRRNREVGQVHLYDLTKLYMLEWNTSKNNVMMSPDFRRVAFQKEYTEDFWVPSRDRSPDTADWGTVTRMSLIGCHVELPQAPQCPNMCTLLLQSLEPSLGQFDASFFSEMKSLKVLDLSGGEIEALPGTINELVSLKSLYLKDCSRLVALPPQADQLVEIEFLDISGTLISRLPQEIRSMVKMRCLRASLSAKRGGDHDPKGKQVDSDELIIPPGIISNLKNLEELSIYTAPGFQLGAAEAERLARELAGLKHLNTLCFIFPNVSSLDTFVIHSKALKNTGTSWSTHTFRSFNILIGCHESGRADEPDFSGIISERWLRYSTNEEFSEHCQELLKQAHTFEIIGHDGIQSFTSSRFDLHPVKACMVERCKNLKNVVDRDRINKENQGSLLQNLEKLYLYDLESLECIWNGPVPPESLVSLKAITINGCPKLTKILDPKLTLSLQGLEYLKVENCSKISKIIEEGRGEPSKLEQGGLLRRLRKIELSNLPELQSVYKSASISLKSMIYALDGPVPPATLANLTTITISDCPKLTKVLDSALARSLQSLQYLNVVNCENISKIIEVGHGESSKSEKQELLESLREIELSNLPLLQSICESGSISISCKSLKSITALRCSSLSNLSLALTNARKLLLIRCEASWWNELQLPNELREHLLPLCHFEEEISQPRGEEASTSGRSWDSNGASTPNMNVAESRGEALANGSLEKTMNSAPSSGETSTSGSLEYLHDHVSKGCFPTCGCS